VWGNNPSKVSSSEAEKAPTVGNRCTAIEQLTATVRKYQNTGNASKIYSPSGKFANWVPSLL